MKKGSLVRLKDNNEFVSGGRRTAYLETRLDNIKGGWRLSRSLDKNNEMALFHNEDQLEVIN